LDGIQLTITEADGSQTVITIPVFTTDDGTDEDGDGGNKAGQNQMSLSVSNLKDSFDLQVATLERNSTLLSEPLLSRSEEQPIR